MSLPKTLQFSATSLQDYVDCPRRFQLRYLLQVSWPAPEVEPIEEQERHEELAREYHRLVHQHLLGLATEILTRSVHDPKLDRWWQAYLDYAPDLSRALVLPEVSLSTVLMGYRLFAQYDVVAVMRRDEAETEQGHKPTPDLLSPLLIIDWKTYRRRPARTWLSRRLQTRVYPLVLVEAGASLFDRFPAESKSTVLQPDQVLMQYWLAEYPQDPELFTYNAMAYHEDLEYVSALILEIVQRAGYPEARGDASTASLSNEIWPLTDDLQHCRYCNYRSLCDRGDVAGSIDEHMAEYGAHRIEDESHFDLDWGQVQEVVY